MEFEKILIRIGQVLDNNGVSYMIIGGQAVIFHSEYRATKDIDLTIGADIDELNKIRDCIYEIGLILLVKDPEDFVKRSWVLPAMDQETGIRVDFIFSFSTYERQAIKNSIKYDLNGNVIKYCSLDDLIIHKIFSGREIDLIDVRKILTRKMKIDIEYIKGWLQKFGETTPENYIEKFENILKSIK